ncbi:MAG: sigma-70 family RNA polymerase sigma factor [Planctomycetota bacterium]
MTTPVPFETLVHRHHAAVYRTAARLLAPADAEDVTQQVFVRVLEGKVPLGPDPGGTLRWLGARLALNTLRGARTRRHNEGRRAMHEDAATHDDHAAADEQRALRRALDDLPPDLRAAVVLRYQEDLTFDDLARAMSCSLSTAHDRVHRALSRLQRTLLGSGFAFSPDRLGDTLPRLGVASSPPPGLAEQLLRLQVGGAASVTTAAAGSSWAIAILAVVAVGVTAWFAAGPRDDGDGRRANAPASAAAHAQVTGESRREGETRRPLASSDTGVAPAVPAPAQDRADGRGHVLGNVFDEADGRPLAATVHATSLRRSSKGRPFVRSVAVDAGGRFDLEVPVPAAGKENYTVWIRFADYAPFHFDVTLADGATREVRAPLHRWAADTPGDWTMQVAVQDDEGRPVVGAVVTAFRQARPEPEADRVKEASATTDAAGRATLRGDHHGEKIVRVHGGGRDLAPVTRRLAIAGAEAPAMRVSLPAARTLAGTVRSVVDGAPVARYCLSARQDDEDVGVGCTDAQGRFTIGGLGSGAVTLVGTNAPWSSFELGGVAPDAADLDLRLKRMDDADPHGLHRGELHGHVVDAAARAPVIVRVWDVDAEWLAGDDWREQLVDGLLHPRPVQRGIAFAEPEPSSAFHLTGLRPGRYAVAVHQRDFAPAFLGPFEVDADTFRNDLEVALTPGGTVRGEVVDAAERPVGRALVYLTVAETAAEQAQGVQRALAGGDRYARIRYPAADPAGRFALTRVPAGLTVRCVAVDAERGLAVSAPLVVRDGEETQVRLRVH